MSAVKLIFKRSSLLGKRPTTANLEAGEIALNTNSTEPGLFFEVNDGSVVKAGPTAYLPEAPTQIPARGELWVDSDTKAMSIGTVAGQWQKVAAPFLGGTNGLTVFVAPEYENATDSLANDGQTVPFVTINRAILEVTKQIIQGALNGTSLGNNRYQIVLAPGQHCVVNTPGVSPSNFDVNLTDPYTEVTQDILRRFNPEGVGGLILPRGVSILGMDLKKCEVHPIYVPKYTHPAFPFAYQQEPGGPIYSNQPRSSIFRWSGNTYLTNFTGLDKIESSLVIQVSEQEKTGYALFKTERPHGLNFNDFVNIDYSNSTDQIGSTFSGGAYYAYPVTSYEFAVSAANWDGTEVSPVMASALPKSYFTNSVNRKVKFQVSNIYPYFVPEAGEKYELSSYSHHRLSVLANASVQQLNNFYIKVQKAFPDLFGGQVNTDLVSVPETQIVAPTLENYPSNIATNSTDNSSPYENMVNHRSDYGMANADFDGRLVTGFKSAIVNSSTAVVLQKDPVAYEIYSTTDQNWILLTSYTREFFGNARPIVSIPRASQLQILNETAIPDIRYFYTTLTVDDPVTGVKKSTGISDPDNDFRHFGFRISGPNSYLQAQSTYTIGAAVSCWSKDGAMISLTNATTNFGSVAFLAEGFAGMGTLGGADKVNTGFLQAGITLPLALTETQVVSDAQKKILSLGSKIVYVGPDPDNKGVQLVYLQAALDAATILPYTLAPGSALFVEDGQCTFRGFFVTNGQPTAILSEDDPAKNPYSPGGAILRLRSTDSNIPSGPSLESCLQVPYIRRFIDPRSETQKSYGFFVESTNPLSSAPTPGYALRLNQTGQDISTSLKRNYQFDPGQYGGISQVFTVDYVEAAPFNQSVNYNNKISDNSQSTSYTVYASLTDASSPWIQSIEENDVLVPFNHPQGSYITYGFKNYFAAENDLASCVWYETTFNPLNGPTKVSPNKLNSPFVITSVLDKQELITTSWQGYVPDPAYDYYTTQIPEPYRAELSYMRGAVIPYQDFGGEEWVDIDDSSVSLGLIFTNEPTLVSTITTSPSVLIQTAVPMSTPYVANPTIGRPAVMTMSLLQVSPLVNPKNGVSVVRITNSSLPSVEYVRVIGITSNTVTAIRNYYPEYSVGDIPDVWPTGSTVTVCAPGCSPEPSVYDPDWAVTKSTLYRYYELMGYSRDLIKPYFVPKYSGSRLLLNSNLPLSPINGYANLTTSWPVEFNAPSTVFANTHTWQYVGFFDYSRGLPKNQVNQLSRKLQFDFLSSTLWGGRLSVLGSDSSGALVLLGDFREALTGNYLRLNNPDQNYYDNIVRESIPPIDDYPSPILTYSTDDISGLFDGVRNTFDLTRGGVAIPGTQLNTGGIFVTLGGVMQIPFEAYNLAQGPGGENLPVIVFTGAPPEGTSCDVRVVTSDDGERTLKVMSYSIPTAFNGAQASFLLSPDDTGIDNNNSFIYLGGVAQTPAASGHPDPSYLINTIAGASTISFTGSPVPGGTTYDFRAIVSGARYRQANYPIVNVISLDDISVYFNNSRKTFPLFVDGEPILPSLVNAENMFVTLGAVIQIPNPQAANPKSGDAYTVQLNDVTNILEITFAVAPQAGTSCTIRVVSSEPKEFITCPLPPGLENQAIVAGDGVSTNEYNEIVKIDSGLIG